jgi:RNA polymerase sigma-32 factor
MQRTATLPVPSADGGLAKYLTEIRKFPILRPEQEMAYARRWREHGDREAAYHLVTSHLRLVAKIAMRYRGYGLPIADIISEGNLGLMHAVKRFEPQRGFRLATYAMWWIKATIQEYILRSWSLVKIGASTAQKKLFFKLRRAKAEISALEDGDLRPEHTKLIAGRLGVKESEVIEMNRRLAGDVSLNAPLNGDPESDRLNSLVEPASSQEVVYAEQQQANLRRAALAAALDVLNPRERAILEARWLSEDPAKLEQLAARYGVSRERIRQIELRAFEKVRASVTASMADDATATRQTALCKGFPGAGRQGFTSRRLSAEAS